MDSKFFFYFTLPQLKDFLKKLKWQWRYRSVRSKQSSKPLTFIQSVILTDCMVYGGWCLSGDWRPSTDPGQGSSYIPGSADQPASRAVTPRPPGSNTDLGVVVEFTASDHNFKQNLETSRKCIVRNTSVIAISQFRKNI